MHTLVKCKLYIGFINMVRQTLLMEKVILITLQTQVTALQIACLLENEDKMILNCS